MDIRNLSSKLSQMALAIGLCLPLSYVQATSTVMFDPDGPDGPGGVGVLTIGTLDWQPSSVVIKNIIPLAPDPEQDDPPVLAQAYAHTALSAVLKPDGGTINPNGLNLSYEVTAFLSNGVAISTNSDGSAVSYVLDPNNEDNLFEIYYHEGPNASPLGGTGFVDGKVILSGKLTTLTGNFKASNQDPQRLDQFLDDDWFGTESILGTGNQNLSILVDYVDKEFFISGVDVGSILPFTNSQVIPFQETNPSMNFDLEPLGGPLDPVDPGPLNGAAPGPDIILQIDPNNSFEFIPPEQACRVTGGGNDTAGIDPETGFYDETMAEGLTTPLVTTTTNKNGKIIGNSNGSTPYRYTMGGQAGANTALPPQPKGEWTHSNHDSENDLKFTFHAGTASAPDGTEIDAIICTDAGFCFPARPAPSKQIDFVGIGTFKNLSWKGVLPDDDGVVIGDGIKAIQPEPQGNKPGQDPATYHWFQVHIEDLGEPGNKEEEGTINCPADGSGNDPFADPPVTENVADCGCGDFYRITIYKGFVPVFENGEITNIIPMDDDDVIYEVFGYINGGNFQIHPLTGFDLK